MTTDNDTGRVSKAYRDLATETAPARLDRRVLERAARESRSRYGLVRAWMRPVAWAATIGLSLAFLLEMTWFAADPPVPATAVPTAAPAAVAEPAPVEDRSREDADVMKAKEEDAVRLAAPRRATDPSWSAPASAAAEAERAMPLVESRETVRHCDDASRATAASWYACIVALRGEGRDDAAAAELDALRDAYPDYQVPPAR